MSNKHITELPILLDCDGVLSDFLGQLGDTADLMGLPYTQDMAYADLYKQFGEATKDIYRAMDAPGFASSMGALPGAVNAVDILVNSYGLSVKILTSPVWTAPTWDYERRRWIATHTCLVEKDVIFAKDKSLVNGRVLVEDHHENAIAWADAWGRQAILFNAPGNQGVHIPDNVDLVYNWDQALSSIRRILHEQENTA